MKNIFGFRVQLSTSCRQAATCLCAALAVLALTCAAADNGKFDGPRWSLLDADKVLGTAKEITTEKYPDSDQATVDKKMVRVYRADGTGEAQDETFTKVLTEKGKRANRDLTQFFMLPYFTVELYRKRVAHV